MISKHDEYIVMGAHRHTGIVYVWAGVHGFRPIDDETPAQIVDRKTADGIRREIAVSQSERNFDFRLIPVQGKRGRIITR